MNNEKRWKVIEISPGLLLRIVQAGTVIVGKDGDAASVSTEPDVPLDARLHHAYYSYEKATFNIVVEHNDFSRVVEGAYIPCVEATFTTIPKESVA